MDVAGWLTIGTKVDNKNLEKGLKNALKELESYDKEAERLTKQKTKIEEDLQPYYEKIKLQKELNKEFEDAAANESERQAAIKMGEESIARINTQYSTELGNLDNINNKIEENNDKREETKNKVEEINRQMKNQIVLSDNAGKKTRNILTSIKRWALAIFGIRSAYSLITQAVGIITSQDSQLAADIKSMKTALASTIEPIIRGIVDLVQKLLRYVQYIIYTWTGKNIFENSAKYLKNSVNSAKELKKQLAGFDEMNVLSDTSSSQNETTLSIDWSKLPSEDEMPKWVKDISKLFKPVIDFIKEIYDKEGVTGIIWKIVEALAGFLILRTIFDLITGLFSKGIAGGINDFFKSFGNALSIIAVLWGFALVIDSVTGLIKTFSESGIKLSDVIGLLGTLFLTLIGLMGSVILLAPLMSAGLVPFGILIAEISAVLTIMALTIPTILKAVKNFINEIGPATDRFVTHMINAITKLINFIVSGIEYLINTLIYPVVKNLLNLLNLIPGINLNVPNVISIPRFVPKLAVGGIVNMPGKGINYGGANIAERGPEAVIPLTNSEMMSELGEAIGKFITINANIVNTMNGRVISKELKKIQANNDFAFNR